MGESGKAGWGKVRLVGRVFLVGSLGLRVAPFNWQFLNLGIELRHQLVDE